MKSRVVVPIILVILVAGCSGVVTDDDPDPTFEDPEHQDLVADLTAALDEGEGDRFIDAVTDDDGPTADGEAILDRLLEIERIGIDERNAVARSIAREGAVDGETLKTIDRILASPESFQATVFAHGLEDTSGDGLLDGEAVAFGLDPQTATPEIAAIAAPLADGGYEATDLEYLDRIGAISEDEFQWAQAEALGLLAGTTADGAVDDATIAALADTSGDGLLDGMSAELGLRPYTSDEAVAAVATPLAQDGYDDRAIRYLERVANMSGDRDNPYEAWAQAEELGLLDEAVANGTVTEGDLWAIENDADNRLINGMEVAFGTDPQKADTSGDGFEDHLKWGPMQDLGLPVHPAEPDVYVEVDATVGVDHPTEEQFAEIQSTLAEEPPEEIGPIHVHFVTCTAGVEPASTKEDIHDRTREHREIRGLGFHYLLINDGRFSWMDGEYSGIAWLGHYGEPFMLARGDIDAAAETSLIAHELGHKMGVFATDFAGVDSTEYTFAEYNSVMNYNRTDEITFSTGPPFNDYEQMAERKFGSEYESIDGLERMWSDGSVDEDALC